MLALMIPRRGDAADGAPIVEAAIGPGVARIYKSAGSTLLESWFRVAR